MDDLLELSLEAECAIVASNVETELTQSEHGGQDDYGKKRTTHSNFDM